MESTELEARMQLEQMKTAQFVFYASARACNAHGLVALSGLISHYIKMCEAEFGKGNFDFAYGQINSEAFDGFYVAEKFARVFGGSLIGKQREVFMEYMGIGPVFARDAVGEEWGS